MTSFRVECLLPVLKHQVGGLRIGIIQRLCRLESSLCYRNHNIQTNLRSSAVQFQKAESLPFLQIDSVGA